jgi:hypothetical protein
MGTTEADPFALACDRLVRIADLKKGDLLDEAEYQELRTQLLAQMKLAARSDREGEGAHAGPPTRETWQCDPGYGHLHARIVKRIREAYQESDQDGKQISLRALAEIANSRALEDGESVRLEYLIDEVYKPLTGNAYAPEDVVAVLHRVSSVNKISLEIVSAPEASATAKAIAGVTQESANEAATEITRKVEEGKRHYSAETLPKEHLGLLWKSLVGEDLQGAMNGAAAAVTATLPFLTNPPLSWTLAVAAAAGAVIGGGVQSGVAYEKR